MVMTLLYILIAIMAFVFAVTTNNTITKEAAVIGTLRASGYTRGELLRHYLHLPVLVTIVAAIIGNILGYTVFKKYGSRFCTMEAIVCRPTIPSGMGCIYPDNGDSGNHNDCYKSAFDFFQTAYFTTEFPAQGFEQKKSGKSSKTAAFQIL